jgi:lipoate-protein ligase B
VTGTPKVEGTTATGAGPLVVRELGLVAYGDALALQRRLAEERIAGHIPDTLLLLEHPPVVTLGRGWKDTSLPLAPEALRRRGIEVHEIERGGDVTYHGPGQLVGYPIFDLQRHRPDLHWYLRRLEETLIVALSALGIPAERHPGKTGVWTRGRKIASIGIHVRQWVTWHGFALNVTTDLTPFDLIVPCGIPDVVMTSVSKELADQGRRTEEERLNERVRDAVVGAVVRTFQFAPVAVEGGMRVGPIVA